MNNESINYHISSSEEFLKSFTKKIDLLYLDTGDMTPIEDTAQLHLREATIIVERDLLSKNGIIAIEVPNFDSISSYIQLTSKNIPDRKMAA